MKSRTMCISAVTLFAALAPTHAFIRQNGVMRDLGTLGGTDQIPASERQEDGILIRHKRVRCPGACSLAQWYYMPKLGVPRE